MMLDLGPFSGDNFDPKKWINSACKSRHPEESVDKHLVDLEMKLQMVSEEISASLEEQSAAALLRVPRTTRDIIRLRDDAVSLRSAVAGILQKLKKVPSISLYCSLAEFGGIMVGYNLSDLQYSSSLIMIVWNSVLLEWSNDIVWFLEKM